MNLPSSALAVVLAGGRGSRLMPLTSHRAKPAVPFGARHLLIDVVLSNLANGGYRHILVVTQYQNRSLDDYLRRSWHEQPSPDGAGPLRVHTLPSRQVPGGPAGSADALYRNIDAIESAAAEHVLLFGADHVYRMDPRQLMRQHAAHGAGVTVAAVRQPLALANQFGVIDAAADGVGIAAFREKPSCATGLVDAPDQVYASMGNYAWRTDALLSALRDDAADPHSSHDVGGDLIPAMVSAGSAQVYDFTRNRVPGATPREQGYWRDVGTLDAYHAAHMDVLGEDPVFALSNPEWPIGAPLGRRLAVTSTVRSGSVVARDTAVSGSVRRSVLSSGVHVAPTARVDSSVLMDSVHIGEDCIVRNAVLDRDVRLAPGTRIGVDLEADRARYTVTQGGVVVVGHRSHPLRDARP
ncbi:MAG TPA: glucose-1-phosphate adenylyltransferase [Actinospica sp.]|nr:glucose-1-phosphate adenylyltransferase [Actinospica sp.]